MSQLEAEIKALVIDALELEDIQVEDIDTDAPLFVDGLGLDSIDALELGLAIKKKYQVKLDANTENTKQHFASVKALAAYVDAETQKAN